LSLRASGFIKGKYYFLYFFFSDDKIKDVRSVSRYMRVNIEVIKLNIDIKVRHSIVKDGKVCGSVSNDFYR